MSFLGDLLNNATDTDPYVENPDLYDSQAKQELAQRFKEFEKMRTETPSDIERNRKSLRKEIIFLCVILGLAIIYGIYFSIIYINLDSICMANRIPLSRDDPDSIKRAINTIQATHFLAALPYLSIIILLGIAAILAYFTIKQMKSPKNINDYLKINPVEDESVIRDAFTPQNFHPVSFADPDERPSPYISPNNFTSEITSFLNHSDSTFDANEFIDWCKKSFFIFWEAWSQNNLEAARIFLNDDLFDKMRSLLEDNIEHNRRDIYRISHIAGCFINKYERESGFEYLTVYLTSIHTHYVLDASSRSNIPIEGSSTENIKTRYQLKFLRRFNLNQKTNIINGVQTIICPNCGGEVTALNAGRCQYCGSVIRSSEFSWVLSDIDEYLRNTSLVDNRGVILRSGRF